MNQDDDDFLKLPGRGILLVAAIAGLLPWIFVAAMLLALVF